MKSSGRPANVKRFGAPTTLDQDTQFLGSTVGTWCAAMTHGVPEALDKVRQIAETGPNRDASKAETSDVATLTAKRGGKPE